MNKGITLIGMPGSGKTTLSGRLAARLQHGLIDVDGWIETRAGMSVLDVIEVHGADHELHLEWTCIDEHDLYETVVSTPGSIIHTPSLEKLKQQTLIVFLDVPLYEIEKRLRRDSGNKRGIIGLREKGLGRIYAERLPKYQQWADVIIDCAGKSPNEIIDEIVAHHSALIALPVI